MDIAMAIRTAYDHWEDGDVEGFLDMFADDAIFVVPGRTPISGDHDKAGFRRVLERMDGVAKEGRHRQEMVCQYLGDSGAAVVFDTHFGPGEADKYHSIHEWVFRDGRAQVWMLYVHEYELFTRLWT